MKAHAAGQYPGAHRMRIGEAAVTALSDGYIDLGPGAVPGASEGDLAPLFVSPWVTGGAYRSNVSAFLVEIGGKRVLVDSGGARSRYDSLGRLGLTLDAIGVAAESIDVLAMTHLHPDHAGGAFDGEGRAAYPNATMMLHAKERAFWFDDANMNDGNRAYFDLARKAVTACGDRVRTFDSNAEIAPGLHAVFLPGHTPGHTGFRIDGGTDSLLVWGDIVHVPPVQMKEPGYGVAFDVDGAQAEATRRAILERAAAESLKIAGMHLPFPAFGSVERDGDGYRLVPAPYAFEPA